MKLRKLFFLIFAFTFAIMTLNANVIEESFESGIPTDWTLDPVDGTGAWVTDDGSDHGPDSIQDGTQALMFNNYDYSSGSVGSITTPTFDATVYTDAQLSFYWWNNDSSSSPAKLKVFTTVDGSVFTMIDSIDVFGSVDWVSASYILPNTVTNVKFEATSDYGVKNTFIDNIIVGTAPSTPELVVTPLSIEFDSIGLTDTDSETISIENGAVGTLEVTDISFSGTDADQFNIDTIALPLNLTNGENQEITVNFMPTMIGDKVATLTITSNAGTQDVALTGTALGSGIISGTVVDYATSNPIDGATVTIDDFTTTTAMDGTYSFELIAGTYDVEFSKEDYATETITYVDVVVDSTSTVDASLLFHIIQPPYTTDFEGTYLPAHWTEKTGTLADTTVFTNETSSVWSQANYAHIEALNKGAKINIYGTSRKEWLITPTYDLGDGSSSYRLDFDMAVTNWNNSDPDSMGDDDKVAVVISTDNGASWSATNTLLEVVTANEPSNTGEHVIIDLSAYTGEVKIGFYAESTVSNQDLDFHIDNVGVMENVDVPVVSISATDIAFGETLLTTTSAATNVNIANLGGGSFEVASVTLSGTDVDQFMLTDDNTYPATVETSAISFDIAFAPTTEGEKSAMITINANGMDYIINLTGTGTVPLDGDLLNNAIPIVFADNSFTATGSNVDYNNDYDLPSSDGNDIVFSFTLTESQSVSFSLQNSTYDTKIAVYGDSTDVEGWVPGPDNHLAYNDDFTWPTRNEVIDYRMTKDRTRSVQSAIYDLVLPAGDYFFILDSYGSATGDYELVVTLAVPTEPATNLVATVVEDDVTLTWEAPATLTADGYNVYRDDVMLNTATITEMTYTDMDLADGTYTYAVKALYGTTEAEAVEASAVVATIEINDPINLNVVDNNNGTADFTWAMPGAGGVGALNENFDAETLPADWSIVDQDGDANNWEVSVNWGGNNDSAHCMTSASYINNVGALTPNNWLISPAVAIEAGATLSFYIGAQDASWAGENFDVLVSTTDATPASFTSVYNETITDAAFHEVTVDLNSYAGQTIYLAWQHHDCTDMFSINLDDIMISTPSRNLFKVTFEDKKDVELFTTTREREFLGYNVFLDDTQMNTTTLTDMNYQFTGLAEGSYTAGVQSVYDEGNSNIVEVSFDITLDGQAPINLNIVDNEDGSAVFTWAMPGTGGGDGYSENFDAETLPAGWQVVDQDGDLNNWEVSVNWGGNNESAHCMTSASYINDVGALTPDNWLISPQISLGAASELTFYIGAQDPSWAGEQFDVLVSTTDATPASFTSVYNETITDAAFHEVAVDLSAYANQSVYIAWQHHDCTDMFSINLDDVAVSGASRALTRDLTGYEVYLDGALQETVTTMSHTFTGLEEQSYTFGVKAVYTNVTSDLVTIDYNITSITDAPKLTSLVGNYPNPFNPTTTISFGLREDSQVSIEIYNVRGQKVNTLVNEDMEAGNHTILWNGMSDSNNPVASGVYFYRMKAGRYTSTKKMILMK